MTTTKNNEHKKLNFSSEREQSQACLNSAEHEKNQGRKVLNVPNLRFPEFQGEWEEHLLGNISDVTKLAGFEFTKYVTYEDNGNIIAIRGLNCKNGSLDLRDVKYIDNSDFSKLSRSKLYTGDILYTYVGTVGEVAVVDKNDKYYLAPNVSRIRLSKDYNSDFIKQLLGSKKFYNQIVFPLIATSSQPALSMENLRKFKLKVPSIREQTKIASLLNAIDERIATQNKIIEDLKKLKSAIIEKLYSEIQGKEYSYRQLFDVVNERNKQMEYSNILSASQEKGMINRDDLNLDIQFERSNINTYKIVRAGDYVIHLRSFQGGFAFSDKSGVCSPAYTILRPNSFLEYSYLSNYFTSQRFIKSLIIVTYGIRDGRSINVDEWLSMKITIPSKEHQQYIVKIIGSFDRKIESEEAYTILLSKQKQYILRQMFI